MTSYCHPQVTYSLFLSALVPSPLAGRQPDGWPRHLPMTPSSTRWPFQERTRLKTLRMLDTAPALDRWWTNTWLGTLTPQPSPPRLNTRPLSSHTTTTTRPPTLSSGSSSSSSPWWSSAWLLVSGTTQNQIRGIRAFLRISSLLGKLDVFRMKACRPAV